MFTPTYHQTYRHSQSCFTNSLKHLTFNMQHSWNLLFRHFRYSSILNFLIPSQIFAIHYSRNSIHTTTLILRDIIMHSIMNRSILNIGSALHLQTSIIYRSVSSIYRYALNMIHRIIGGATVVNMIYWIPVFGLRHYYITFEKTN